MLLAAFPIPTAAPKPGSPIVEFTPIEIGSPLYVGICSIFPGEDRRSGQVLVTSQAKDAHETAAGTEALHYFFKELPEGQAAPIDGAGAGSDVIYYSPGLANEAIKLTVRLRYDGFNAAVIDKFLEVVGNSTSVPLFLSALGPAGSALFYATTTLMRIFVKGVNWLVDHKNDWTATARFNFDIQGATRAQPGYIVFFEDGQTLETEGGEFVAAETALSASGRYAVDPSTRTLIYADTGKQVLDGPPYVLAVMSGQKIDALASWKATALAASLSSQFLEAGEGETQASDLFADALSTYNDIVMVRKIGDLDAQIADSTTSAADLEKLKLSRTGTLKNVQDDALKKLLAPA